MTNKNKAKKQTLPVLIFAFIELLLSACATNQVTQTPSGTAEKLNSQPVKEKKLDPEHEARFTKLENFLLFIKTHPGELWSPNLNPETRQALKDYAAHKLLPNQKVYGDSVRKIDIRKKMLSEIQFELAAFSCEKHLDYLKYPSTQTPVIGEGGQIVPIISYVCPDGGIVRLKTKGDPTSKFRPQAHGSKAVRYPYDAPSDRFEVERFKVDARGEPLPKWVKDMNVDAFPLAEKETLIEGWAEAAHVDLAVN